MGSVIFILAVIVWITFSVILVFAIRRSSRTCAICGMRDGHHKMDCPHNDWKGPTLRAEGR